MQIDIITLFPELLSSPFEASILKRAIKAQKVVVNFHNLRDYTQNKQNLIKFFESVIFNGNNGFLRLV